MSKDKLELIAKIVSVGGSLLGIIATVIDGKIADRKQAEYIKEIAKASAEEVIKMQRESTV